MVVCDVYWVAMYFVAGIAVEAVGLAAFAAGYAVAVVAVANKQIKEKAKLCPS